MENVHINILQIGIILDINMEQKHGLSKRLNEDMVKTLGELKTGDTFYLIHWQGGHISSIESKVVDSILDIKIGRIIHYDTDKENKTGLGLTLKNNELNENVIDYHYHMQVCSDKNVLYEIIENDKEEFMYNYQQMLLYLKYNGKV